MRRRGGGGKESKSTVVAIGGKGGKAEEGARIRSSGWGERVKADDDVYISTGGQRLGKQGILMALKRGKKAERRKVRKGGRKTQKTLLKSWGIREYTPIKSTENKGGLFSGRQMLLKGKGGGF